MPDVPSGSGQIGILVLDDDVRGRGVLRQVLDSEGWSVRILADPRLMLSELATGDWSLVIANVGILGLESPAFQTLRELALVPAEDGARLRVLFLLPETSGSAFSPLLDRDRLPYVARPFHLHDLLEKVSDLLVEIKAIEAPIRQVRRELVELRRRKQKTGRQTSMFATRESYGYTEEELAEYERTEEEEVRKKKSRKKLDLGNPYL
jgi:DNA-binding response OmpR family regulator